MQDANFLDSKFWRALERIVEIVQTNVLWVLFSVPIFTIGAATTAFYYTLNKSVFQNRGYVYTEFKQAFKNNFKQATAGWLIFLVLVGFNGFMIYLTGRLNVYGAESGNFWIFFVIILGVALIYALYFYTMLARFKNSLGGHLKNAFTLMIVHFPSSLTFAALTAALYLVVYKYAWTIFFAPAIYLLFVRLMLEPIFRKYMTEEEVEEEELRNYDFHRD